MHYNTAWQCKKSAKYDIYFQMVRFLKFPSYCVPFLPGCKTNPSSACFVTAAYSARLTHIALSVAACLLQWQIMWPLGPQNLKYLLPVPLQKMFADSWCKLQHNEVCLFSTVAIINYHKLSGLKKHSLLSYGSRSEKSENGSYWTTVKVSVGDVISGISKGESVPFLLPVSGGHLNFWLMGPSFIFKNSSETASNLPLLLLSYLLWLWPSCPLFHLYI